MKTTQLNVRVSPQFLKGLDQVATVMGRRRYATVARADILRQSVCEFIEALLNDGEHYLAQHERGEPVPAVFLEPARRDAGELLQAWLDTGYGSAAAAERRWPLSFAIASGKVLVSA